MNRIARTQPVGRTSGVAHTSLALVLTVVTDDRHRAVCGLCERGRSCPQEFTGAAGGAH